MSIEKIEMAVIAEARKKAEEIITEAQNERETVLVAFKEDSVKRLNEAIAQAEQAASRETNRLLGLARHKGRLEVLKAKNTVLNTIFSKAAEKCTSLPEKEYMNLIVTWISSLAPDIGGTLRVNPRDIKLFTRDFIAKINTGRTGRGVFTEVTADPAITAGFIIESDDYSVDVTIDRKINELRETLSGDLAKELFGS